MPLTIAYPPIALPAEEPGPAFSATLRRTAPSLRARLTRPQRLRSSLLAALAVLGLSGTMGWSGSPFEPAAARASVPRLQPFESPGDNFPGSAFYYLAPDSGVVAAHATAASGEAPAPLDARLGDARARPTFLAGTGEDRFRALHCLTTAIYYEAATEPDAGQRAVAQVVLNRVAHPQWPNSVCGVVFQGSERPGCQFSFACDGSMARAPARMWWQRARAVAERALAGEVYAPVGLATYYHTGAVNPVWAARMNFVGTIGAHLFYRPPGAQGRLAAFTDRYWGGEPSPAPRPRIAPLVLPVNGPMAIARAYDPKVVTSRPVTATAPGDEPTSAIFPNSGRILPQYRNSGRWIASPAG